MGLSKEERLKHVENDILNNLSCKLKDNAKNLVFGKGNINASIFIIGEAPGEKEDLEGIPFVGRAGKNLNKHLNKIGLSIEDVYIANILKYRPPKNRNPTKDEIISHTPYLIQQIEIIKPKVIITLGNYSTKFILSNFDVNRMKEVKGISVVQGRVFDLSFKSFNLKVIPMYHPAAMLYRPRLREEFEESLKHVADILGKRYISETQKKLI